MTARRFGSREWRSSACTSLSPPRSGGVDMKGLIVLLIAGARVAAAQWSPQQSGTNAEFRGLSAVSGLVAWASGTRGRVAHTSDGGKTWKIDTVPGAASL